GSSRGNRPLHAIKLGSGPANVSITAGAHADEPVGPLTAILLTQWLLETEQGRALASRHTFWICPQVNPDGAETNSPWFFAPHDPWTYLRHANREPPGDDVEFSYPGPGNQPPARRPENEAVAAFLRQGAPYIYHASLHGMAYSEGAWFLICKEWVPQTTPLQE